MTSFDEKYFIGGAESNYVNYPKRKYKRLAKDILKNLNIYPNQTILDYGCATGNLVKEINKLGFHCYGTDISEWAIDYALNENKLWGKVIHYDKNLLSKPFQHILLLDVLEHCNDKELRDILERIPKADGKNIIVRIPISKVEGYDFVLPCSRQDTTHIQCHSKMWWYNLFTKYGFIVQKVLNEKSIYDSKGVLAWML